MSLTLTPVEPLVYVPAVVTLEALPCSSSLACRDITLGLGLTPVDPI